MFNKPLYAKDFHATSTESSERPREVSRRSGEGLIADQSGTRLARRLISVIAMFLGALAGALLVLHVHIVYPLVIALVILAAVAFIAVARARSGRPPSLPA